MTENEVFRANLTRLMADKGLTEATLSKRAGLNARAVTDIREGRAQSPKLSTIFALARGLGVDPAELIGVAPQHRLKPELVAFLAQLDEAGQERLLAALAAFAPAQPE